VKGLILTYIVAYSATVASLRFPLIGLYVYAGLAILRPQEIFRFAGDIKNVSLVVGIAVLVGWALQGFGVWRLGRARVVVAMFLTYVLLFVLAAVFALNPTEAWGSVFEFSKVVLPFLAGVTLIQGEKDWRPLLWTIVLSLGYVGFEENLNYLKGFNTAQAGFGGMDNNFFGLSLVTTLGPAIALTLASRRWWSRLLAAASTALILHTILLTFSRGAMVGLIAIGVAAFVMMPKRPKNVAALLVVALLAARLTGPELFARYSTAFVASSEERDRSAESRLDLWKDCLVVIQQYPVFGVGPANWRTIASKFGWPEGKSAHSVWMETAAECGIPATLALICFFGLALAKVWPTARAPVTDENRYEVAVASGLVLAIVGFSVSGQFVSAPALEVPYYITMVGIGLLKGKRRESREPIPRGIPVAPASQSPWSLAPAPTGGPHRAP
jgi:probable O-glycosylation ligase (exosortase A-associated)